MSRSNNKRNIATTFTLIGTALGAATAFLCSTKYGKKFKNSCMKYFHKKR